MQIGAGMCPSRSLRATACALIFAFLPACSAMLVTPLEASTMPSSQERPECTSVAAAPLLDSLVAVAAAGLAVLGAEALAGEDNYGSHSVGAVALVGGGTLALTFGGSAYGGFSQTSECSAAQQQWDEAHAGGARVARAHADYLP